MEHLEREYFGNYDHVPPIPDQAFFPFTSTNTITAFTISISSLILLPLSFSNFVLVRLPPNR